MWNDSACDGTIRNPVAPWPRQSCEPRRSIADVLSWCLPCLVVVPSKTNASSLMRCLIATFPPCPRGNVHSRSCGCPYIGKKAAPLGVMCQRKKRQKMGRDLVTFDVSWGVKKTKYMTLKSCQEKRSLLYLFLLCFVSCFASFPASTYAAFDYRISLFFQLDTFVNQIPKPTGLVSRSQIYLLNSIAVFETVMSV